MQTFVVGAVTATFTTRVLASSQTGELVPTLQTGVTVLLETEWANLVSLVSPDVVVRRTLSGDVIVQIPEGAPGVGTLTIPVIAASGVDAILTELTRNQWFPSGASQGTAKWLLVAGGTVL